jgi:putative SOS response-associated peptidase YedK
MAWQAPPVILQPHYNIAPTDPVDVIKSVDGGRRARADALGPHSMVVEKAPEAIAGDVQRASGQRCRQAHVSGRLQTASVHHPGIRLYRCIIPASGYYEWLKMPDGKQPYFISAADGVC